MPNQFTNSAITTITVFTIVTIPFLFAAVQPWVWSIYGLLMMVGFILQLWASADRVVFHDDRLLISNYAIFMLWTIVLCLPLPFKLVSILSPKRSELLITAATLIDLSTPVWGTFSYVPRIALSWWVFLLSLGLFFIVVRQLCAQRKILQNLVYFIIGVGLFEALYGMIQSLVPSMGVLWVDYIPEYMGTARGTFINRNNFAGFLEMIWPLALGITLAQTGRVKSLREALGSDRLNRQALMALGIIVLLLALLLTRSRAGIASGMVGFFVFTFTARAGMRTFARHSRILLGGIVVLVCLYAFSIGVTPILERFLAIRGDASSRMEIWQDSLAMVTDHPMGIGLRNFENVFKLYNHSMITDKSVVFAHNDYLQLLIESGWIGFLALGGAFLVFLGKRARQIRRYDYRRDPFRFYLAVGAFSGLISIAVHSLFDFNMQIPANCLYFVVLMAILNACTSNARNTTVMRVRSPQVKSR